MPSTSTGFPCSNATPTKSVTRAESSPIAEANTIGLGRFSSAAPRCAARITRSPSSAASNTPPSMTRANSHQRDA